jgi:branched-chain amino acid transport system ATP-binding protein
MMTLLSVRSLSVAYGKVVALDGVSLDVEEGELVALVGANGAGKSTLMRAIMGLTVAKSGEVAFCGERLSPGRTHEMARRGIAYVPEGRGTLRELSVRENLLLGAFSRHWDSAARADFEQVLEQFPVLAERLGQSAGTLSGGEQQMLVIGRALMSRPKLMLLDEPSLGLAPIIAKRIFEIIAGLTARGVTVLLVEQNAHAALKLASRAYVLEMGKIVLDGSDLLNDDRVREAYLGELITNSPSGAGS